MHRPCPRHELTRRGCPSTGKCQKLQPRLPIEKTGSCRTPPLRGASACWGPVCPRLLSISPPEGLVTSPHGRRCAQEAAVLRSQDRGPPALGEMRCVDCSVSRPWAGNEGSGTGLAKLWVTEAWPLTSMQELLWRRGGGREELGPIDRTGSPGRQTGPGAWGMVASNQEQPTEDLSGTLNPRGRLARPGTRARRDFRRPSL